MHILLGINPEDDRLPPLHEAAYEGDIFILGARRVLLPAGRAHIPDPHRVGRRDPAAEGLAEESKTTTCRYVRNRASSLRYVRSHSPP